MSPNEKKMVDLAEKHVDAALSVTVNTDSTTTIALILRQVLLFAKDVIVAIRQDG